MSQLSKQDSTAHDLMFASLRQNACKVQGTRGTLTCMRAAAICKRQVDVDGTAWHAG